MKYIRNVKMINSMLVPALAAENHPENICFPTNITITTTLKCNYRCRMCYQEAYDKEIPWEYIEKIQDIFPFANIVQLFGGEPFLYPRINELIEMISKHQCGIMAISNGSLLNEALCQRIVENNFVTLKFSVDAGTPKTYKKNKRW